MADSRTRVGNIHYEPGSSRSARKGKRTPKLNNKQTNKWEYIKEGHRSQLKKKLPMFKAGTI